MDTEEQQIEYLTLKKFLERNPCVNSRTFARWKQKGLIDCIQPGGPGTQILVPEDALARMELRRRHQSESNCAGNESSSQPDQQSRRVRPPDWK